MCLRITPSKKNKRKSGQRSHYNVGLKVAIRGVYLTNQSSSKFHSYMKCTVISHQGAARDLWRKDGRIAEAGPLSLSGQKKVKFWKLV